MAEMENALGALGGLVDACGDALTQLSEPSEGEAVAVRAPRSSRGIKRSYDFFYDEEEAAHALAQVPSNPAGKGQRLKRPVVRDGATMGGAPDGGAKAARQETPRRARAPRSPDEKRKLSRQMAAFMRAGVLVLPPDVKLQKKHKKGDEEGLEYRAAFNLLLDLCFGESLRAWAHCSNWAYLWAVLIRMATDGAVELDPEAEAALEDNALLRKASDQQNAQWRLNEQRLKQLGVKKEQLCRLFRCVTEGRPIELPPPPKEANWSSAGIWRPQAAPGEMQPAAAPPASKPRPGSSFGRSMAANANAGDAAAPVRLYWAQQQSGAAAGAQAQPPRARTAAREAAAAAARPQRQPAPAQGVGGAAGPGPSSLLAWALPLAAAGPLPSFSRGTALSSLFRTSQGHSYAALADFVAKGGLTSLNGCELSDFLTGVGMAAPPQPQPQAAPTPVPHEPAAAAAAAPLAGVVAAAVGAGVMDCGEACARAKPEEEVSSGAAPLAQRRLHLLQGALDAVQEAGAALRRAGAEGAVEDAFSGHQVLADLQAALRSQLDQQISALNQVAVLGETPSLPFAPVA